MSELTKCELAAMWLFGDVYAPSGLSARDFWKQLEPSKKQLVRDMIRSLDECDRFERETR